MIINNCSLVMFNYHLSITSNNCYARDIKTIQNNSKLINYELLLSNFTLALYNIKFTNKFWTFIHHNEATILKKEYCQIIQIFYACWFQNLNDNVPAKPSSSTTFFCETGQ